MIVYIRKYIYISYVTAKSSS